LGRGGGKKQECRGGRGRERGRERILRRLHSQHGDKGGTPSHDPEIMT